MPLCWAGRLWGPGRRSGGLTGHQGKQGGARGPQMGQVENPAVVAAAGVQARWCHHVAAVTADVEAGDPLTLPEEALLVADMDLLILGEEPVLAAATGDRMGRGLRGVGLLHDRFEGVGAFSGIDVEHEEAPAGAQPDVGGRVLPPPRDDGGFVVAGVVQTARHKPALRVLAG